MSAPLSVTANPNTTVSDSCNCASCCPVSCCMPLRGRRVRKAHVHQPPAQDRPPSDIEIHSETTLKVHGASQPVLQPDGSWAIILDGKKYALNEVK